HDSLHNAQAAVHGAPGLVFMGRGVAKIDQQAITEILRDMAFILLDDLRRGFLVGTHHGAVVFRIELARELRGTHQVTEQHRELPPFRLRDRADRLQGDGWCVIRWRCWQRCGKYGYRWAGRGSGREDAWQERWRTCPDQDLAMLLVGDLSQCEFFPHLLQPCLVEAQEVGQRAVCDPLLALEYGHHHQEYSLELALRPGALAGRELYGRHRSRPDQDRTVLISGEALALNEFMRQIVQGRVVELELPHEGAVGQAPVSLEHGNRMVKNHLKGHRPPSLCR